ncbi:hypothetical protein [Halovivax cerinus]|uniref:DUF3311 domain-containing protein n=1 Tax=Halovivax cerinus TaxID=1487865 RepID=A0ABD5NRS7_9EURY|nr:hypothetical protein [Halovivax cerinus]
MVRAIIPRKWEGKLAVALLVVAHAALAPPLISVADSASLVAGWAPLYLWTLFWGSVMGVVLLWAAKVDAWGISMDQVPPELRDETGVVGFNDTDRSDVTPPTADRTAGGDE